jgi:metal-responsive CopG/Arc/MetJ family transcriptional regulator
MYGFYRENRIVAGIFVWLLIFLRKVVPMSRQLKLNNENETKLTIRIENKLLDECDKRQNMANCKNRTQYIEKALNFYNRYLDSDEHLDYLTPILSSIIKSYISGLDEHLSRLIFKMAVELAKNTQLLASVNDCDDDTLRKLHKKCLDEVNRINGIVRYENAVRYQQGD